MANTNECGINWGDNYYIFERTPHKQRRRGNERFSQVYMEQGAKDKCLKLGSGLCHDVMRNEILFYYKLRELGLINSEIEHGSQQKVRSIFEFVEDEASISDEQLKERLIELTFDMKAHRHMFVMQNFEKTKDGLYGKSLEDLMEPEENNADTKDPFLLTNKKIFPLSIALAIYDLMLRKEKFYNSHSIIHRDAVPGNMVVYFQDVHSSEKHEQNPIDFISRQQIVDVEFIDWGLVSRIGQKLKDIYHKEDVELDVTPKNYTRPYFGDIEQNIALCDTEGAPLEMMIRDSKEMEASAQHDIYSLTNILVRMLTGYNATFLTGDFIRMYIDHITNPKNKHDEGKRKLHERIERGLEYLKSVYGTLIPDNIWTQIHAQLNDKKYDELAESAKSIKKEMYLLFLKDKICKNEQGRAGNETRTETIDSVVNVILKGTADFSERYKSADDAIKDIEPLKEVFGYLYSSKSTQEPDITGDYKIKLPDEIIRVVVPSPELDSLEPTRQAFLSREQTIDSSIPLFYHIEKLPESTKIVEREKKSSTRVAQPSPPQQPPSSTAQHLPSAAQSAQAYTPSPATPQQSSASWSATSQQPLSEQVLSSSAQHSPSAAQAYAPPATTSQQPLSPLISSSVSSSAQSSLTPKPGDDETLILDDEEARTPEGELEKAVAKLERRAEQKENKDKKPKLPVRINLLAQKLKEKYAPWYQKHKKAVVIAASAAALLGTGGLGYLGYHIYNKYSLCCPSSLDFICGEDTCSEPEPKPEPTPPAPIVPKLIPKPSGTPRVAEDELIKSPRRAMEEIVYYWWWCRPCYGQLIKEPGLDSIVIVKDKRKQHVSRPIEINLLEEGISGIKTKDNLKKEFDPEKGIEYDSNKLAKPIYDPDKRILRVRPKKDADCKPVPLEDRCVIKSEITVTVDNYSVSYPIEFYNEKPEAKSEKQKPNEGVILLKEHGSIEHGTSTEVDLRDYFKDDGDKDSLRFSDVVIDTTDPAMKGKIKPTLNGSKLTLEATDPDFTTEQKRIFVKFKARDENSEKVESWSWIAVTPVNDCPRVNSKIPSKLTGVIYVPFTSPLEIVITDLFDDPEDNKLTPITTSRDDMTLSYEIGGERVTVQANKKTKLWQEINVDLSVTDSIGDKCQLKNGDLSDVNSTKTTLVIYYHDVKSTNLGEGYHITYRILDNALAEKQGIKNYACDGYTSSIVLGNIEMLLTSAKQAEEETGEVKYTLKGYCVLGKPDACKFTPISGSPTHYTANIANSILPSALTIGTGSEHSRQGMICIEVIEFTKTK